MARRMSALQRKYFGRRRRARRSAPAAAPRRRSRRSYAAPARSGVKSRTLHVSDFILPVKIASDVVFGVPGKAAGVWAAARDATYNDGPAPILYKVRAGAAEGVNLVTASFTGYNPRVGDNVPGNGDWGLASLFTSNLAVGLGSWGARKAAEASGVNRGIKRLFKAMGARRLQVVV